MLAQERAPSIPRYAGVVLGFLNTIDLQSGRDDLATPAMLGAWLRETGLLDSKRDPTAGEHALVLSSREALRALAESPSGGDRSRCVGELNEAASLGRMVVLFDDQGNAHLHADAPGVPGANGRIMAAVFRSMVTDTWPRLKICRMHECRRAFYDQSKNQSKAWCSMKVCGNRAKVRSYRARSAG